MFRSTFGDKFGESLDKRGQVLSRIERAEIKNVSRRQAETSSRHVDLRGLARMKCFVNSTRDDTDTFIAGLRNHAQNVRFDRGRWNSNEVRAPNTCADDPFVERPAANRRMALRQDEGRHI